MIELQDIKVVFNAGTPLETTALNRLNLTLGPRDFVTVIGSNGAGKSTLLNVVAGDQSPASGRVIMDGEDVTNLDVPERSHLVARVFQDPLAGTSGALTLAENLALAMRRGASRGLRPSLSSARRAAFRSSLRELNLGLENRLDEPMARFSGGERQAACLLMASLAPSKLLLLDEPTAALDPKMAETVLELAARLIGEHHLTALMVTHSMRQALELGTRTIMMHKGHIVFDIAGEARRKLEISDLLALFRRNEGEELTDDAVLLD